MANFRFERGNITLAEFINKSVIRCGQLGQVGNPPGWFGADHAAFISDQIILQILGFASAPLFAELAKHAEKDHRQEIVDQRRVPACNQTRLELAEFGGELIESHVRKWRVGRRHRLREACIKRPNFALQDPVVPEQANRAPHQAEPGCLPPRPGARGDISGKIVRDPLPHPHHLFHKLAIHRIARQHRQQPIPVEEIVIDPTSDQSEHLGEDCIVVCDHSRRNLHNPAELPVSAVIGAAGEGEREGSGNATVAFGDVRIVPDRPHAIAVRQTGEGCDGPGLE